MGGDFYFAQHLQNRRVNGKEMDLKILTLKQKLGQGYTYRELTQNCHSIGSARFLSLVPQGLFFKHHCSVFPSQTFIVFKFSSQTYVIRSLQQATKAGTMNISAPILQSRKGVSERLSSLF